MTAARFPESRGLKPRRPRPRRRPPSAAQRAWLSRGLDQPGGKLPLFEDNGAQVRRQVVEACIAAGWAERWFDNPLKPDWLVCRLTDAGRAALGAEDESQPDQMEKEQAS